eukprot:TRINITY_DN77816_c0_g1_i1.p1 TRINITY_DN77816_c0_g1~~TRINITY_DN77816_c0_g1_i1.p1  ORF type:complete len:178 (-),score=30.59 TRINITY_DN77816_c0_g1_i1:24-491(-)
MEGAGGEISAVSRQDVMEKRHGSWTEDDIIKGMALLAGKALQRVDDMMDDKLLARMIQEESNLSIFDPVFVINPAAQGARQFLQEVEMKAQVSLANCQTSREGINHSHALTPKPFNGRRLWGNAGQLDAFEVGETLSLVVPRAVFTTSVFKFKSG